MDIPVPVVLGKLLLEAIVILPRQNDIQFSYHRRRNINKYTISTRGYVGALVGKRPRTFS